MMRHTYNILFVTVVCITIVFGKIQKTTAQSFHGLGSSRYGGVQNVVFNPALINAQENKYSFHILSIYSALGSDYSSINFGEGAGIRQGFQYNDDRRIIKNDNSFYKNVDLVGPSFTYRYNDRHSFGIITRVRGVFNANNINGILLQSVDTGFDETPDFVANSKDFSGTLNVWTEFGFTYGYRFEFFNYTLDIGANIKYLQGIGGVYAASANILAEYNQEDDTLRTDGELLYGTTAEFEEKEINFNSLTGGFAFDFGIVLELKDSGLFGRRPLRAGISINDFGQIKYTNTITSIYDLDKTGFTAAFDEDIDIRRKLNQRFDSTLDFEPRRLKLPGSLHFFADVAISQNIYFGIESSLSLIEKSSPFSNRVPSYFTLNPRMEKKWISIFSPLSIQQHTGISWGAGCRLGIVFLGSESVLSSMISPSRTSDFFVGVYIPIYK